MNKCVIKYRQKAEFKSVQKINLHTEKLDNDHCSNMVTNPPVLW